MTVTSANMKRPSSWLIAVRDFGASLLLFCTGFCLVFSVLFLPLIFLQGVLLGILGLIFLIPLWLRIASIRSILEKGEQIEAVVHGFDLGFKPSQTWIELSVPFHGETHIVKKKVTSGPSAWLKEAGQKVVVIVNPRNPDNVFFRDDFYKGIQ